MRELPNNETRIRLLDRAEELFSARGYTAVRLRDIADAEVAATEPTTF
jgi:AcrR family transcriptional regulator